MIRLSKEGKAGHFSYVNRRETSRILTMVVSLVLQPSTNNQLKPWNSMGPYVSTTRVRHKALRCLWFQNQITIEELLLESRLGLTIDWQR